jgi:hypothetical protein
MKTKITAKLRDLADKYLYCKLCDCHNEKCAGDTHAVICWRCVCRETWPTELLERLYLKKVNFKRPVGWHFMAEYVDKTGKVFHKGVEQPELKGTLKPTKIKRKKKKSKTDDDVILVEISKLKKELAKEHRKSYKTRLFKKIEKLNGKLK